MTPARGSQLTGRPDGLLRSIPTAKAQLWKNDEKVGEVLFNDDTHAVTADMEGPNDQAQVESVIAAADSPPVGFGEMEELTYDPNDTWFGRETPHKLESLGFDYRVIAND